ncbi:hypothetical protein ScPMuIL_015479 [Solemya velum]
MQSKGFIAIDRYMASCNLPDSNVTEIGEIAAEISDQKVPQYNLGSVNEESETSSNPEVILDFKSILDFGSETLSLAPAPSATCTYVNSVADQQIYRDGSPTLHDMDTATSFQDLSFYDEVAHMKEEKSYGLDDFLINQDTMYPGQSGICALEQAELSFVNDIHIKQEAIDTQLYWDSQSEQSEDSLNDSSLDAIMERSIIENLQQFILGVARELNISEDPGNWTSCDVHKWVLYYTQASYPETYKSFMQLTGRDLCRLMEEDFLTLAPETGTNLYSQLDIWKNAPRHVETPRHRQVLSSDSEMKPNKARCHIEHKQTIHLWQFLRELLEQPGLRSIKWVDRERGIFKIEDSATVAKLWGRRKNRPKMDYDKLSRSIRQYYKKAPRHVETPRHRQVLSSDSEMKPNKARCHIEHKQTIHLWQFLRELLEQPGLRSIKWVDRERGIFKIEDSATVAKLWGRRKNRPKMDYDKLSRSIRQYYKKAPRHVETPRHRQVLSSDSEMKPNKARCHIEHKQTIHLWQFLRELLEQPGLRSIKWVDRERGIFKIEDSATVAKLWGRRKNRPKMDYDKLSRSIRQYYKKGIIKKTEHSKRLVYQFCPGYL